MLMVGNFQGLQQKKEAGLGDLPWSTLMSWILASCFQSSPGAVAALLKKVKEERSEVELQGRVWSFCLNNGEKLTQNL